MKQNRFFIVFLAWLAGSFAICSCSKEEETTVELKNYMYGSISSNIPEYAVRGTLLTLEAGGIQYPTEVTYKWVIPSIYADTIPYNPVSIVLPDSVCTVEVTAIAAPSADFESEYYSTTLHKDIIIVDTAANKSLTGLKLGNSIIDQRDGKTYHTVTIGNLEWFAENLAWGQDGVSYSNSDVLDAFFGKYYTWDEATGGVEATGLGQGPQGVCPKGWSIPTNEDWTDLAKALSNGEITSFNSTWKSLSSAVSADAYINGSRLWPYSPDNDRSNTSGFNAIPSGNYQHSISLFSNNGQYAFWWSASQKDARQGYYRYLYYDNNDFSYGAASKSQFAASVRCVKRIDYDQGIIR